MPSFFSSAVTFPSFPFCIWYILLNCSWFATRWQQYSTHLHTNSTQNDTKQTEQHNKCLEEYGPCPVYASYTLAFALQLRKKHGKKPSVRVALWLLLFVCSTWKPISLFSPARHWLLSCAGWIHSTALHAVCLRLFCFNSILASNVRWFGLPDHNSVIVSHFPHVILEGTQYACFGSRCSICMFVKTPHTQFHRPGFITL